MGWAMNLKKTMSIGTKYMGRCTSYLENSVFFFRLDHKDVAILKIEKDEASAANIPRLTQFYYNHLFQKGV